MVLVRQVADSLGVEVYGVGSDLVGALQSPPDLTLGSHKQVGQPIDHRVLELVTSWVASTTA